MIIDFNFNWTSRFRSLDFAQWNWTNSIILRSFAPSWGLIIISDYVVCQLSIWNRRCAHPTEDRKGRKRPHRCLIKPMIISIL